MGYAIKVSFFGDDGAQWRQQVMIEPYPPGLIELAAKAHKLAYGEALGWFEGQVVAVQKYTILGDIRRRR